MIFTQLSLRAERGNLGGVPDCGACSEPKPERREEPSEESRLEIASSSLTSWGIPRNDGRDHCKPLSIVIASRRRGNLRKIKRQNDRARMKNGQYEADGY